LLLELRGPASVMTIAMAADQEDDQHDDQHDNDDDGHHHHGKIAMNADVADTRSGFVVSVSQ
jgi:hypothetical protein